MEASTPGQEVAGLYGWRLRIGLIVPSSNTTMESEFHRMRPEGVSVHTARMELTEVSPEALMRMAEGALRAAELLSTAEVDVIIYGCTTGALVGGMEWERGLVEKIEDRTGIRTITTAGAVVEAMKTLGMRRICVATPYIKELDELEVKFLAEHGIEVLAIKGLSLRKNTEIGRLPPWTSYRLAKEVFKPGADGLFISCTNFRTIDVIEPLERELGVPVVTSNQASMWAALRLIHQPMEGFGRLLREYV